jgi:tyrosyl-tRNA synthetase
LTTPILEGIDGEKKMSKSYDNYVALEEEANVMFGKIMSIPDKLIIKYFSLATRVAMEEINQYENELKSGKNPRDVKMKLAHEIVRLYHNSKEADQAQEYFVSTFSKGEIPAIIPELTPSAYDIITVLVESKICKSKSEARQVIDQGGVKVNDVKVPVGQYSFAVKVGDTIQKGSRWFVKVI